MQYLDNDVLLLERHMVYAVADEVMQNVFFQNQGTALDGNIRLPMDALRNVKGRDSKYLTPLLFHEQRRTENHVRLCPEQYREKVPCILMGLCRKYYVM